ncbi:MAG TPA: hypothetical protein VGY66_26460, partial [Gemmataceae bacterium]|nr:hypothetical protein [Gemmataceae bacterium]
MASGNDLESRRHRLQHKHRNASSERSPNHRKANYDLDQFTEENSNNPSLNSTLGCLKVVDTFRAGFSALTLSALHACNARRSDRSSLTLGSCRSGRARFSALTLSALHARNAGRSVRSSLT